MERITLDPDQERAVERMATEPTKAALNGSLYGTGKTVVTVELAHRLGYDVKIIVCPVLTRLSWKETILRQYPDSNVELIDGTARGKRALDDLVAGNPGWYLVGREYFATKRVQEALRLKWKNIGFLAYDECQKWANRKSQGYRMMSKVQPEYKLALSATPYGDKFQNMYTISKWLWPKSAGGFWNWAYEWCRMAFDPFTQGPAPMGEKNPGAFVNSLPCYIRLEADFGEPEIYEYHVELSASERKLYNEFEKYLIVWLQENPLVAKLPVVKRLRLREMTLGMLSYDPVLDKTFYDVGMKSTKYDALKGVIESMPTEPILVLTHSQKFAEVVAEKLRNDGYKAMEWSGKISTKEREQIKAGFIDGEVDYIVATIGSIGEGVDGLQRRARVMVWLSRDDYNMLNQQAFRRLYRRGQERTVVSIDIVVPDTYDEGQLAMLVQKQLNTNASLKKEGGSV